MAGTVGSGNSTRAFRTGAIPEKGFEGFLAGGLVQEAFAFFWIQLGGEELVAGVT